MAGWIDNNPSAIKKHELDKWVSNGTINFLGKLKDVRPALENCSVYVLPSYREGTPRTVLEAMATGRAILTTDAPGCRETVVDGENGYIVPLKDYKTLAAKMIKMIEFPQLNMKMANQSHKIVTDKYNVNEVNKVILKTMNL